MDTNRDADYRELLNSGNLYDSGAKESSSYSNADALGFQFVGT